MPFIIQLAGVSPGCTLPEKNNAGFNFGFKGLPRVDPDAAFLEDELFQVIASASMAETVTGPMRSLSSLSCRGEMDEMVEMKDVKCEDNRIGEYRRIKRGSNRVEDKSQL